MKPFEYIQKSFNSIWHSFPSWNSRMTGVFCLTLVLVSAGVSSTKEKESDALVTSHPDSLDRSSYVDAMSFSSTIGKDEYLYKKPEQSLPLDYPHLNFNANGRIDLSKYNLKNGVKDIAISYRPYDSCTLITVSMPDNTKQTFQVEGIEELKREDFIFDRPVHEKDVDGMIVSGGDNDDNIALAKNPVPSSWREGGKKGTGAMYGRLGNDVLRAGGSRRLVKLDGGPGKDSLYGDSDTVTVFAVDSDLKHTDDAYNFRPKDSKKDYKCNPLTLPARECKDTHDYIDIQNEGDISLSQIKVHAENQDTVLGFPSGKELVLKNTSPSVFCEDGKAGDYFIVNARGETLSNDGKPNCSSSFWKNENDQPGKDDAELSAKKKLRS